VYGNSDVETPHLRNLANDGVRYDRHFCPFPICTPSRYSLLSGKPVHEHEGWTNHSTLNPEVQTLPKELLKHGYTTSACGKMHFTPTYLDVGFQRMKLCEQLGPGRWDDDYHRYLMEKNEIDFLDILDQRPEYRRYATEEYWRRFGSMPTNLREEDTSTAWIGRQALDELESWGGGEPNFLMVGFRGPHHPFDPPGEWLERYNEDELELLPGWTDRLPERDASYGSGHFDYSDLTPAGLRKVMAHYYASISHIDSYVGKMIETLKRRGLYDRTMIIYTSDHGEYMGFHHMLLKGNYMYDPVMRIPLVIKYPENRDAGTADSTLSMNTQMPATILKTLGLPEQPELGRSPLDTPRSYVFAHAEEGKWGMVRSECYKLLRNNDSGERLLFDLRNDPFELEDISDTSEMEELMEEMTAALTRWQGGERPRVRVYLDENAPIAPAHNARPGSPELREPLIRYYADRFRAELKG
jgi:arylsulfatase A-like enzyme